MPAVVERQLFSLPLPAFTEVFPNPFTRTRTRSAGLTSIQTTSSDVSITSSSTSTESASSTISEIPSTTSSSIASTSTSSLESTTSTSSVTSTPDLPVSTDLPVVIETNSNGNVFTVTVQETASPSPSIQALPNHNSTGFLQNKVASGLVFTIVGIVGLALLATLITFAIRYSRKRKLHQEAQEAICFAPPTEKGSMEKRRFSLISSDNAHGVGTLPYMPPPPSTYNNTRQDDYRLPALPTFNNNQYSFNGIGGDNQRQQQPYYGTSVNGDSSYGGYTLPSETRPARSYHPETYQPSPPAPIGTHSTESSIQFQRGHTLKASNV